MSLAAPPRFTLKTLDQIEIEDEPSFQHVALYRDLKSILIRDRYRFRVMPERYADRWDRALLLNLTYFDAGQGGDVLLDAPLCADVVAHVAWHHLASRELANPEAGNSGTSADAMFFGESIASAFDVYLVGRLLENAPDSSFLATQIPAMAETAAAAGLPDGEFEALLESLVQDPERAFSELRELLFDATCALYAAPTAEAALAALAPFDQHRFGSLLHRFELSNWALHARAYADPATPNDAPDAKVRALDAMLRNGKPALEQLVERWVTPRIA